MDVSGHNQTGNFEQSGEGGRGHRSPGWPTVAVSVGASSDGAGMQGTGPA
jgi:hypothetical protein